MKRIILAILVIGVLAGGYIWFFVYNKSHRNHQAEESAFVGNVESLKAAFFKSDGSIDSNLIDAMVELSGQVTESENNSVILNEACIVHMADGESVPSGESISIKGRLHGIQDDIIYGDLIAIDHAKPL